MSKKKNRVIDVVNSFSKDGKLDVLFRCGLVSTKAITYRDMYLKYDAYLRQGLTKKEARKRVASFFNGCEDRTVFRAISLMSTPI